MSQQVSKRKDLLAYEAKLTILRTIGFVIGMTVIPDFEDSAFQSIARADYVDKVKELIYTDGPGSYLNSSITQGFCTSLGKLRLLCTSAADLEYLSRMHSITIAAATNPAESTFIMTAMGIQDVHTNITGRLP